MKIELTEDEKFLKHHQSILSDPNAKIPDRIDSIFEINSKDDIKAVDSLIRSFA